MHLTWWKLYLWGFFCFVLPIVNVFNSFIFIESNIYSFRCMDVPFFYRRVELNIFFFFNYLATKFYKSHPKLFWLILVWNTQLIGMSLASMPKFMCSKIVVWSLFYMNCVHGILYMRVCAVQNLMNFLFGLWHFLLLFPFPNDIHSSGNRLLYVSTTSIKTTHLMFENEFQWFISCT